jgi:hypothetical protein
MASEKKEVRLSSYGLFDETLDENKKYHIRQEDVNEFWEANSESESESLSDKESEQDKPKLLSFRKLKHKIYKQYDMSIVHKYSTALDLFVRYIQCYHILYSEASYYCSYKLNLFMLPCMFLSTACSVLTAVQFDEIDMVFLLSVMNGVITFLLAIINYLKLDANAEAHKISAYQCAKLKSQIEFYSGELLLHENDPLLSNHEFIEDTITIWKKHHDWTKQEIMEKYDSLMNEKEGKEKLFIDKVQSIIVTIKETLKNVEDNNNFSLPPHILSKYGTIYNMNIFLHIKSIDTYKNVLLNDLRNVKNEIRFYTKQGKSADTKYEDKFVELYHKKNDLLEEFLELNKGYSLIDHMLQQEITNIDLYSRYWYLFYLHSLFPTCFHLPQGYKHSNEIGYIDKKGDYLLDKVLRY